METKVVQFPHVKGVKGPKTDHEMALDVRKAYARLCRLIDAATERGLHVELFLDSSDTFAGGHVRSRNITITRKI